MMIIRIITTTALIMPILAQISDYGLIQLQNILTMNTTIITALQYNLVVAASRDVVNRLGTRNHQRFPRQQWSRLHGCWAKQRGNPRLDCTKQSDFACSWSAAKISGMDIQSHRSTQRLPSTGHSVLCDPQTQDFLAIDEACRFQFLLACFLLGFRVLCNIGLTITYTILGGS